MSNTNAPDQANDPTTSLIVLLDAADALPGAAELRARSYDLLGVGPGLTVADVGCGVGRAVAEMAERGARAMGVDLSPQMIAAARRRRPEADLQVADACQLPFADGELSGYRAERLFHALDDPSAALAEAYRVLAPGGRIVLIGQDWDTLVIDSDDPQLTRSIVHARADTFPSPRAARQYRNLLLDAGFADIAVEARTGILTDATMQPVLTDFAGTAHAAGAITDGQARTWSSEQARRARTGRLFFAVPVFLASARRSEPTAS